MSDDKFKNRFGIFLCFRMYVTVLCHIILWYIQVNCYIGYPNAKTE